MQEDRSLFDRSSLGEPEPAAIEQAELAGGGLGDARAAWSRGRCLDSRKQLQAHGAPRCVPNRPRVYPSVD